MGKNRIMKIIFYSLIIFFGLALTILFYFILNNQTGSEPFTKKIFLILRPFIIGGVIAYIMKSTCNFFDRIYTKGLTKSGKRDPGRAERTASKLSLATTYLIWLTVITVLVVIVAKPLIESTKNLITSLFDNAPIYVQKAIDLIHKKLADHPQMQDLFESAISSVYEKFNTWKDTELPTQLQNISTDIIVGVWDIVILIKDILIGLVISFLLLSGRKALTEKSKILIRCIFKENAADAVIDEFRYADRMFSGFLEGKVIDSALIGVLYYIALLIMKVPYAPLIAVICGVTNIIPIFGPFIGAVPSALIIFTEDPIKVVYFLVFVCIMQFIDGNIIDPHIVGGSIKMSGFCVLFAVILFGGLWGFAGLLVGVPVFAVIYDIVKKIIISILRKKNKEYLLEEFRQNFPSKEDFSSLDERAKARYKEKTPAAEGVTICGEVPLSESCKDNCESTAHDSDNSAESNDLDSSGQ